MDRPARVHVLYLERAEDQRTSDGKRSAGLHLEQTPGLGPYICTTCDAVADTWRNRCDNFQCALRMCCAEGALFRPSVAQFAVLSPRAALAYPNPNPNTNTNMNTNTNTNTNENTPILTQT